MRWLVINAILMLLMAAFIIPFLYMTTGGFKYQNEIASTRHIPDYRVNQP